eukprot:SAG11_NODE_8122_length_1058_cov_1.642336_2_plen_114_part_01
MSTGGRGGGRGGGDIIIVELSGPTVSGSNGASRASGSGPVVAAARSRLAAESESSKRPPPPTPRRTPRLALLLSTEAKVNTCPLPVRRLSRFKATATTEFYTYGANLSRRYALP